MTARGRRSGLGSRLLAIARRDTETELSYRFRLASLLVSPFIGAFLAFYIARLVGTGGPLAEYDGTYFDYVVVGLALTSYAALGVSAFTQRIAQEQTAGTLEVLLAGPTRLPTLLAGGFIVPLGLTTIQVVGLIGIGVGLVGTGLSPGAVVGALPVLVLMILNFVAVGVVAGAVTLLSKRGDPISRGFYQLTLLLSGAVIPLELFPGWMQLIGRATPAFYGVRGLRDAVLTDGGVGAAADEVLILLGFAIITVPLAIGLFAAAVRSAKRYGILGTY
ncbi:ABC transporter permease [Euzebya tangerina]|uniref:ABC transporter permease n=1 Tax=Euzebya tangerina TaxID=591198 RepID=UPI000E3233D2|nr:ABC transporter permease [Euzebya tangerina]